MNDELQKKAPIFIGKPLGLNDWLASGNLWNSSFPEAKQDFLQSLYGSRSTFAEDLHDEKL
jgi:hypothetical protein